ncbi:TPA: tape measure protein [Streptococcus suis]|nr:tape measure protein [Streptococcus suis]HEL2396064.1 tape measure protein [Streptococcus suis]HEL9617825.1 tape measure protein [Streptococcus suis]
MADGSVTIKVDLDGSSAQSGVSKLKTLLGGLESTGSKVGSVFKSVLGANLISSALTTGIGVVTGGIRDMASELTSSQKAWKTFEGNLQAFGRSPEVIKAAKTEMQDFATKTIYSASDMASTYSQLDAVGTKNVGSLVKAFGGLAASAENPAQAMKSLSTQATQMASKPKVAWNDFRIMMEQAPAGVAAIAKEMGMSTAELVAAVQDGQISTEAFFDAMNKAGNSDAFQKMATEFKTWDQAIDGAKESLSNKLMPMFEHLNKFGIKAINALSDAMESIDFSGMADGLGKFLDGISNGTSNILKGFSDLGVFDNFKTTLASIGEMFRSVFKIDPAILNTSVVTVANLLNGLMYTIQDLASGVADFFQGFSDSGAVRALALAFFDLSEAGLDLSEKLSGAIPWETIGNAVGQVVKFIADVISVMAQLSQKVDGNIFRGLLIGIPATIAGFKAFNFLKSFNPFNLFKQNATSGVSGATSVVRSASASVVSIIRSLGQSVATAARGIGQGIGAAFRGIGQGLAMVNPATIAALAVPILALGAAFALMGMQGQGIATILQGVGSVIVSVGTAIGTILNLALQGLAQALVIVAPVLPTIASAFAMLSPVIIAAGAAISMIVSSFSSLAPVITALGTALSQVITAISSGIAQIATAVTPIVAIISNAFVQVVTVVSNAIVQIIQALAPFIPAITQMVQAVAPVLQSLVEAFNNLISQISPIIDSLTQLLKTFGEQVSSILESAGSVVESFGSAIRNVLDGVAGIFESMGNAAKNAGQGVKLMAQGIKMLVDLKLGDLVGTLAAVATGLTAIAGSGIASAGPGLQQAGTGLRLIATSAQVASVAMQALPAAFSSLSSSIGTLPSAMTTAGSAMMSFAGLAGSTASISALQGRLTALSASMMMAQAGASAMSAGFSAVSAVIGALGGILGTVPARFTAITTSAMMARTSIMQLATSAPMVASGFANISSAATSAMTQLNSAVRSAMTQAVSTMRSSMQQMVSVVRQSASQMTQAGQQAGRGVSNGVTNGIRSGIGSATAAMSAMVNAIRSTAMAGAGAMRGVGAMIGQGLAQGMYSALGAVTAAANALVAQAERAAQAKAKIHSPSRLFRDNVGRYIAQGIAVGVEKNTSDVTDSLAYVQKEMSAFKFGAEELLGLGNSSLSSQFKLKSITERAEMSQIEIIRDQADQALTRALEVAEQAVKRPVNMVLDDGTLVAKIGQPMTNYQNDKIKIDNMMRGIV